jgi:GH43 family beta-xylosidase
MVRNKSYGPFKLIFLVIKSSEGEMLIEAGNEVAALNTGPVYHPNKQARLHGAELMPV